MTMNEKKIGECLKKFSFQRFRSEEQEKAIRAIIDGQRDVFISFPTGAGKSLCYQFPAVYKDDGLSIVISPLLALIHDQVKALNEKKIVARTLNSTLTPEEKKIVLGDLMQRQPTTRLLYITPELAATQGFFAIIKKVHERKLINYLIIDEAHCVSQWGHDYRPDYLKLGTLHDALKDVPCIAVTATASQQVIDDVYNLLHLKQPVLQFKSSVFRSNLFYDVQFKDLCDDPFVDLCDFLVETKRTNSLRSISGIVYCRTRDTCSELANRLNQTGKFGPVKAYHAGLTNDKRSQIQQEWMDGQTTIICATISFGMGIDKSDVRIVVHWDLAKSISGYYQESGRAGRDGLKSFCRMYYSARERDTQLFLINQEITEKKINDEQKTSMINGFNALVQYCEQPICRHTVICQYFGDLSIKSCETMCDVCTRRDLVTANLQKFKKKKFDENSNRRSTTQMIYRNEGSDEQYEGGRSANRREERDYADTDDSRRRDDDEEIQSAKLATKLVQNELKRRAAANENRSIENKTKAWSAAGANCPLIDPNSRKIPNVTVQLREHVCRKLKEALLENINKHFANDETQRQIHEATCLEKAVWLEHQVFLANKSEPMYKMKYMSKCNEIGKATKNNGTLFVFEMTPSVETQENKRKLSETDFLPNTSEPETKVIKSNGHANINEEQQQLESIPIPSLSPVNYVDYPMKSRSRTSSSSSSSSSASSSSSSSSSSSKSTNSSTSSSSSVSSSSTSSSKSSATKKSGKPSSKPQVILSSQTLSKKKSLKSPVKRTNGDTRQRRSSLPLPITNPSDVKAKQARGTLKTCLESMSNFLHQKLNEQSTNHSTIQSPQEEPVINQGSASSPSFLNDQEQQNLSGKRSRQPSLDERIRSILHPADEATKEIVENRKHTHPKKRSHSLTVKSSSSRKITSISSSSSLSTAHKRSASTSSSSTRKSSSTKKLRDSKLPVNIKTISEVVVDVLNPYYQSNRFSSKELFKTLAKRISQHLATKQCSNIDAVRMDAKSLIKPAFRHKHSKILTHADLDRIVPPEN